MTTLNVAINVDLLGIGLLGPGLTDWASGAALLCAPADRPATPTAVPAPQRLPATERRRAGLVVKAAIVVADQACAAAGVDPAALPTVFTSSTGDPANCHLMCEALAAPERMVSPTRFTNSVHNAPAGYWHIAVQGRQASTSLAGFDASFGAGLLEAAAQCVQTGAPVLLVACDVPYPEPLHAARPVTDVFALAFVLAPSRSGADLGLDPDLDGDATPLPRTTLSIALRSDPVASVCADAALEALRRGIPAARALPLLDALAHRQDGSLVIEAWPDLGLAVTLRHRA